MSESLFQLVGQYKELYSMLTEDDTDSEVVEDTLEAIAGEIEVKSSGYVAILNRLDMEIDACKKQKDMWSHKLAVRENAVKRLKQRLADAMIQIGKNEIQAGDSTIKLKKNGGQLPLQIFGDVPNEYMKTKIIQEKDSDKIRKALDEGKELDFASLGQRGVHVEIK